MHEGEGVHKEGGGRRIERGGMGGGQGGRGVSGRPGA